MQLMKWTLAAIASLAPLTVLADEPPAQPNGSATGEFRLTGDGPVFVIRGRADQKAAGNEDAKRAPEQGEQGVKEGGITFTLDLQKREKGAYLGVSASPPTAALRKQLSLSRGMGLMIDFVVPDSPAAKAGLEQYDVLQKLDDQLIINPPQLSVLVRSHKPGDEIKLGIIHQGKPATLTVKLVEHELDPLPDEEGGDDMIAHLHGILPEPMVHPGAPGLNPWSRLAHPRPGAATTSSLTWLDDGHSYTIAIAADGHKTFTAKDKDGKVIFEGPIDTKEQRDKLPADQKENLHHMEQHMGGTLKSGGDGAGK
ncbi:MAG TPA: PDZ domain-containing protein [Tepidisphaeraceae bacterium]|jgi:hypothetical protein|nr:PDZ domain-containing protein [Tepidisphaeraceae bacterium]